MKALVTGAGGFLGAEITRQLLARGDQVRGFARGSYPDLAARGAEMVRGDLGDAGAVAAACRGVDVIFHVAAKAGIWGKPKDFVDTNVGGTVHVLDACRAAGVPHLVYTSSPSVVQGGGDVDGVDESVPYPQQHLGWYPRTKAEAERRVRAANGPELATVGLRPHLIWGPDDPHFLPRLRARAAAGKLRRIGYRDCPVDTVHVENAAEAHLLAADRLRTGAPLGGRVYFITNGEPMGAWTFINRLLSAVECPPVERAIPTWLATTAGTVLEGLYSVLPLPGEPPMTRMLAKELSTSHWFDISAARRDLGYTPRISIDLGLERLARWWRDEGRLRGDGAV